MTQQPHEPGTGHDEEPIEQFLERLVNGEPISRRTVLRRFTAAGLTVGAASSFLAACGGVSGHQEVRLDDRRREREPPTGVLQQGRLLELAALHRPKVIPGWNKKYDGQAPLPRGLQRQRGVLRQGPAGARGRPQHRPRPRRPDRLDGRALDRSRLRDADRQEERAEREEPPGQPQAPAVRQEPRLHAAVAVRHHGHRLQPEEDRPQAHECERPVRPGLQGPGLDVHRVARLGRARPARRRARTRRRRRRTTTSAAIAKIDEENKKGQIRKFTGNDYTKDLASGNLWACIAWSGDLVQLQADNPNLEFLVPEEGAMTWSDNMLIPQKPSTAYGAETFMNYVYDPQVAAVDRGVRELLLPGQGREGGARRTRAPSSRTTR